MLIQDLHIAIGNINFLGVNMSLLQRQPVVLNQLQDGTNVIRHILMTSAIQCEYTTGTLDITLNLMDANDLNEMPFELTSVTAQEGLTINFKMLVGEQVIYSKKYNVEPETTRTFSFAMVAENTNIAAHIQESVENGKTAIPVVNIPPPTKLLPSKAELAASNLSQFNYKAKLALRISDPVVLRCYEAGIPMPQEWKDYRVALRVCAKATVVAELPTQPAYPAGT